VGGFDLFGIGQVNEYHEVEERTEFLLNELIIPFYSQDFFGFGRIRYLR
jgi:hypothetical protein